MQYYLENLDAIEMAMRVAGQHEFKRKTRAVRCGLIDDDYQKHNKWQRKDAQCINEPYVLRLSLIVL